MKTMTRSECMQVIFTTTDAAEREAAHREWTRAYVRELSLDSQNTLARLLSDAFERERERQPVA